MINIFCKEGEYTITNLGNKSPALLYTNNKRTETQIRKIVHFTSLKLSKISCGNCKQVKDLDTETFKSLRKKNRRYQKMERSWMLMDQ